MPPPSMSTTVRTPHVQALVAALRARDVDFQLVGGDRVVVQGIAPDDLGWLAAGSGVVVYEMTTHLDD